MPTSCSSGGCSKRASYGVKGGGKAEHCVGHADEGTITLKSAKCAHQGCRKDPSFGVMGTKKREFCREHAKNGMVDLKHKKCEHPGCSKGPSYGVADSKKREFCREHAQDGMVDLNSKKKCAHQGCTKHPSFGVAGAKKREVCREHAKEGMIDLINKTCAHQGCSTQPSFGVAGTKKREFCREHAKDRMVDLINKKCAHQGCGKGPSFGVAGSNKREHCREHAKEGMVDLINKKCAHQGCSKQPSYGVAGTKKREFCKQHATEGMVCQQRTADGFRGSVRGLGASAAPAGLGGNVTSAVLATPVGSSSNASVDRAPASRTRRGRAPPSTQPWNGGGNVGQASTTSGTRGSEARRPRVPVVVSPKLLSVAQGSAIAGKDRSFPPQQSPTEDGEDTSADSVKTEEVTFSTSLVVSGAGSVREEGPVAHRVGTRRGKRKGCAQRASGGVSGTAAVTPGQGSTSSNRRHGKRARGAVDDDVVIVEPDDGVLPGTSEGVAQKRKGASVAIKPER